MNEASDSSNLGSQPILRVASCSYEGSIFGWKLEDDKEQIELSTKLDFGFNISKGSLKAVSCSSSGKYLVTGGMDERIHIFNMFENKAIGELTQHTGAITGLKFFQDTHLLSSSEDCTLCIWRVYDWQCIHVLGGHKDTIVDFSVHPTGKLALSISKDHTLKLWNLVQGRCAFTRRLKQLTEQVEWNSSAEHYLLTSAKEVQLITAVDNACVAALNHSSRINHACFVTISNLTSLGSPSYSSTSHQRIATICDNKSVNLFDFQGRQTACVDMSSVAAGRPRAMWSSLPATAHMRQRDMQKMVQDQGHCLAVVTSTGQLIVLGVAALEAVGVPASTAPSSAAASATASGSAPPSSSSSASKTASAHVRNNVNKNSDADEHDMTIDNALLSSHQIQAEPRLTAVIAWNTSNTAISQSDDAPQAEIANRTSGHSSIERKAGETSVKPPRTKKKRRMI
mmetsp:Transcript_14193/g.23619  ORF Transcript_14193/g.23619 Transcript_14193/m.23619 type:complete len:454 (+) Transcript_14193:50-1411(+)